MPTYIERTEFRMEIEVAIWEMIVNPISERPPVGTTEISGDAGAPAPPAPLDTGALHERPPHAEVARTIAAKRTRA